MDKQNVVDVTVDALDQLNKFIKTCINAWYLSKDSRGEHIYPQCIDNPQLNNSTYDITVSNGRVTAISIEFGHGDVLYCSHTFRPIRNEGNEAFLNRFMDIMSNMT